MQKNWVDPWVRKIPLRREWQATSVVLPKESHGSSLRNLYIGRDWGQEEKGTTEDEMAGWHHRLDGYEFGWTLGVGDGQGGLACCNSWGRKESDTTEQLTVSLFS